MKTVSGRTRRTLLKTPRTATERFVVDFGERAPQELLPGEIVIGEYEFTDCPYDEPIVFYSRRVELAQAEVLSRRLQPQGEPVVNKREPSEIVDATGYDLLAGDEFWPIIDLLEGKAWESRIARASRELAKHPEEFVLRFAQTMAWKVFQLDHPENVRYYKTPEGTLAVTGNDFKHGFGAIMAGGKARFDSVISAPGTFEDKWHSDLSFAVLYLASFALERQRGKPQQIETSWEIAVGKNSDNWHGKTVEVRPHRPLVRTAAKEVEVQADIRKLHEEYLKETGIDPEFSPFDPNAKTWFVVRFFANLGTFALEIAAIYAAPKTSPRSIDHETASELAKRAGGSVMGEARGYSTLAAQLFSQSFFQEKRKSSISTEYYLKTFVEGLE